LLQFHFYRVSFLVYIREAFGGNKMSFKRYISWDMMTLDFIEIF